MQNIRALAHGQTRKFGHIFWIHLEIRKEAEKSPNFSRWVVLNWDIIQMCIATFVIGPAIRLLCPSAIGEILKSSEMTTWSSEFSAKCRQVSWAWIRPFERTQNVPEARSIGTTRPMRKWNCTASSPSPICGEERSNFSAWRPHKRRQEGGPKTENSVARAADGLPGPLRSYVVLLSTAAALPGREQHKN